ncbi:MAG: radical SAM protein [bacterium]|nr:radical SAM protein [bacterium]
MKRRRLTRKALLDAENHLREYVPGRIPLGICYPNSYRAGMAGLGFQVVYGMAVNDGRFAVSRFFDDDACLRRGVPVGLETGETIREIEALAFSVTYEPDYLNLIKMLKASGLNPLREERGEGDPLVIVGGIAPTANPLPISPISDVFFRGEAEAGWDIVLNVLARMRGAPKIEILESLNDIPGVYIPYFDEKSDNVAPAKCDTLRDFSASTTIVTRYAEFGAALLLEPIRGCPRKCAFCLIGHWTKPVRNRELNALLAIAEDAREKGVEKVGVLGSAVTDYENAEELFAGLLDMGYLISASSLNISSTTPAMLEALAASGQRTVTLSPETASPHLRKAINKPMQEVKLNDVVSDAAKTGIRNVKLYYLLGLPGEEDEDAAAIAEQVSALKDRNPRLGFEVSVNPIVAKRGTGFEDLPLISKADYRRRTAIIRDGLRGKAKLLTMSWKEAELQRELSVGGEGVLFQHI